MTCLAGGGSCGTRRRCCHRSCSAWHTEQGVILVASTTVDARFFGWLAWSRYLTVWASVLVHGFVNSIGMVAYFPVGPIHGLWLRRDPLTA